MTTAANQAIDLALDEVPGGVLIEFFTHWLVNLFAVDCDGVVIGQRWTWGVNELKAHTDAHNPWVIEHAYHGTDSAVGCGGNSDYTGTWIIVPTSPFRVEPLVSPDNVHVIRGQPALGCSPRTQMALPPAYFPSRPAKAIPCGTTAFRLTIASDRPAGRRA